MVDDEDFDPPLDPRGGCPWVPGTQGKVDAICERADNNWALWHPDDATHDSVKTVNTDPTLDASIMSRCCGLTVVEHRNPSVFWSPTYKAGKTLSEFD
jgi:hypothetical protein